jgi:hypothetical protein
MWSPLVTNGSKETYNTEGMCQMDFADSNLGQHFGESGTDQLSAMVGLGPITGVFGLAALGAIL